MLLEVLLALGLFVFASAVVSSGLNAAVERLLRLKAQTHALDLACSVLSEIELGLKPALTTGAEPFEAPFDTWTWEVESTPYAFGTEETVGLQLVTVVVRGGTPATVQRLTQVLTPPRDANATRPSGSDGINGGPWAEPRSR